MKIHVAYTVVMVVAVCLPAFAEQPGTEKLSLATDAPRGLTPEQSRQRFQVPDGFRVDLVAAEPNLAEPTGMCFDEHGRIFVCEIHGYNLDGYYDIVELNKTGVLDKAVRRIPASKEAQRRADRETHGTVRLLKTNEKGDVVGSVVFADGLPPCYGIIAARDGIIALCAPEIIFLADRGGSGKADFRETLFSGFGVGELWTRISNPRWGFDNWIYAAAGEASRGTIRGPHLNREVPIGSTCFRFKADGSKLEPVSGGTAGFGLAIDDWGDRFLCTNQQHALFVAPLPYDGLARNPYCSAPDPISNICSYGHPAQLYPTSPPDPWRHKRGEQPEWVRFYGAAETTAGLFTSACAPTLYQAHEFPEAYWGNHFSCEPAQNLIHRCLLVRQGAGFKAVRAEERKEFLTSTDSWFRPVNLTIGPEGALYVVDMYREIIEDYSAIPRYLQQQYAESLRNGHDKGRIWRIFHGMEANPRNADLADFDRERLIAELASPNVWRRLTAQRLIVERGDKSQVAKIEKLFRETKTPLGRLHVLYTLEGLDALRPELIRQALADGEPGLRVNALTLAAARLVQDPAILAAAIDLKDDMAIQVRLRLAFILGASNAPEVLPTLGKLAERDGQDRWMQAAILSSVPTRSARLTALLLESSAAGARAMLHPLAAVAGARNQEDEVSVLLQAIAGRNDGLSAAQTEVLNGLIEGLGRNRVKQLIAKSGRVAIESLLKSSSDKVRKLAIQVAGLVKLDESPVLAAVRQSAIKVALDDAETVERRSAALSSLTGSPKADLTGLLPLLEPRQPLDLQMAAVRVIGSAEATDIGNLLIENWNQRSPRLQSAILEGICGRRDRLPMLLDALEKKVVDPSSLPAFRQNQLLDNADPAIRNRAKKVLAAATTSDDRRAALDRYQPALNLPRNSALGRAVFEKTCMKCHQLNGRGQKVGPDLAAVQDRPDESILVDILDPSSTIAAGFRAYLVTSTNGKIYSGVMAAETATSMTLRREQGAEDTILRKDIEQIVGARKSLMPEGLEKEITPQQMADLFGYLRESLRPSPQTRILFGGEASFAKSLTEGTGRAMLNGDDKFAGRPSLQVSPPQRFSSRISEWNFKIAEKPKAGEFRYLRFAWKTTGFGIMIELADDGNWPDVGAARCRYVSGANNTGWQATRVAPEPPREWTVVTRDLWKDFGPIKITGLAPTAIGGEASFAQIELLQAVDEPTEVKIQK